MKRRAFLAGLLGAAATLALPYEPERFYSIPSGKVFLPPAFEPASWSSSFVAAEEIALFVPVPDVLLGTTEYDIWTEVKPMLEEAVAEVVDNYFLRGLGGRALTLRGQQAEAMARQLVSLATRD